MYGDTYLRTPHDTMITVVTSKIIYKRRSFGKRENRVKKQHSRWKGNDQEPIQSNFTSCPKTTNRKGIHTVTTA